MVNKQSVSLLDSKLRELKSHLPQVLLKTNMKVLITNILSSTQVGVHILDRWLRMVKC